MSAVPPAFNPQTSFSTLAQQPISSTGLPGSELDGEFARAADSINQIKSRLSEVQRDDGKLRNNVVSIESLSESVRNMLATSGARPVTWSIGGQYAVGDLVSNPPSMPGTFLCIFAHTSSSAFTSDLANWALVAAPAAAGILYTNTFIGNGSTTVFTLNPEPVSKNNTQLFIDGIYQPKDGYSLSGSSLTITPAPAAGSDIEVSIGAPSTSSIVTVTDGSISTSKIEDLAVTTPKIANLAITEAKLANGSVSAGKLTASSVSTDKLSNGSVTTDKIALLSVTSEKIAPLAISFDKIANSAISNSKLSDNSVSTAKIFDLAVNESKIAAGAISSGKIANGAVTPAKLSTAGPSWDGPGGTFTLSQLAIELGNGITSNTTSYIDFHSSFPPVDFDARIARDSGVDGWFAIENKGAGRIVFSSTGGFQFASAPMPNPAGNAPIFGARAWVNFNGNPATPTITGHGNVSGVARVGAATGRYTITFATPMPDTNYAIFGWARDANTTDNNYFVSAGSTDTKTTSSFVIEVNSPGGTVNSPEINVMVMR
jgi:hypothetical protein